MAIDLAEYDKKAREAVQAFWGNREQARQKQIDSGNIEFLTRGYGGFEEIQVEPASINDVKNYLFKSGIEVRKEKL